MKYPLFILSLVLLSCGGKKTLTTTDLDLATTRIAADSNAVMDTLGRELRFRISDLTTTFADSVIASDSVLIVGDTIQFQIRPRPLAGSILFKDFQTDTIIKKYRQYRERQAQADSYYPKPGNPKGSIKDWYEIQNQDYKLAVSRTVCFVPRKFLTEQADGSFVLQRQLYFPYQGTWPVCDTERFSDQPYGGPCSGFAINGRQVVTAGHCVLNIDSLKNFFIVFNFRQETLKTTKTKFSKDEVYSGIKIIHRASDSLDYDFAVLQVDRPMPITGTAKIRTTKVVIGEKLFVAGHPCGWPVKVADLGEVKDLGDHYFVSNLDTFAGNSGSAVYDSKSNIVGILVKGSKDFDKNSLKKCYTAHVCAPFYGKCTGEQVSIAAQFASFITP